MDWDKVGENIWIQVTELIKNNIERFPLENIFRAEFFSLNHQQILKSYENLRMKVDESKSLGVYARMIIDLRLGLSYSTLNTNRLAEFFPNENKAKSPVSYGPCQFPTFWFWYERMCEIRDFKPRKYWSPVIQIVVNKQEIELTYEDNEMESKDEAIEILTAIKNEKFVEVVQIESLECILKKPKPMNTNDLLIMAARKYGFDSNKTRLIAEWLYENGFISYPRTQGRNYSTNEEIQRIILITSFIKFNWNIFILHLKICFYCFNLLF